MLARTHSIQARAQGPCRGAAVGGPGTNRVLFRVDGLHANGLVSYAFDAKITTKQALGEAATVRCDVRPQRLDVNFTLGQRVKLRLSESINAALEFRA